MHRALFSMVNGVSQVQGSRARRKFDAVGGQLDPESCTRRRSDFNEIRFQALGRVETSTFLTGQLFGPEIADNIKSGRASC